MPEQHQLIFAIFTIFAGAAVLSTFALLTRQSMLVAYMILGGVLGPWGVKIIDDPQLVRHVGDIGILFLLFLLGLHLPPQKLWHMLKKVSWVGFMSSVIFAAIGFLIMWFFAFTIQECIVVGAAMMFSSTIIGIKLLPTTVLHHQHTGEVMISVLLLQDLLAILVLLMLRALTASGNIYMDIGLVIVALPALLLFAYAAERFVLHWLLAKFNRIKEYLFLLSIAWCLTLAQLAASFGLSAEIGAFIAGVSLAASPIAVYIAESLKPIRDFFLVMFFFSVGATFNLNYLSTVIFPAILLAGVLLLAKPLAFRFLLQQVGENKSVAWEVGVRLGQISEFSLIIAYVGMDYHLISDVTANCIQAAAILSFMVSSYWVVMRYPTPVAMSDRLRRD
jgi:Kef-type K+ transport system membrane component KefB